MKRRALLLLGANLGDRARTLRTALKELGRLDGCRLVKASRFYETAPVGPSDKPYLNAACALETTRSAMGLLVEAKRLEAAAGRRPGGKWRARELDVDLVELAGERVRTPWLVVPHPLMESRAFALGPLAELSSRHRALFAAMRPDPRMCRIWHGR